MSGTPAPRNIPELVALLLGDSLCQRFMARIRATGDNKVRTADDVLGERLMRLAAMIAIEHENPGWVICPPVPGMSPLQTLVLLTERALTASPYLWTEEVRHATRELTLPRHTISPRVLPQPRSWHTFETGIIVGGSLEYKGRRYKDVVVDALLVTDASEGCEAIQLGEIQDAETGEKHPCVLGARLLYGSVYPDDIADESVLLMAQSVLTMFSFLNSPYIPKKQQRVSRSARRESARGGKPFSDDHVTFIMLRRAISRKTGDEAEQSVNWKHRWLVSGHIRAQWYPSERAHHLIWIAPYLKGPLDAPMLTHAYKVAR